PIAAITCPDAMSSDATCHDATCLAQLNAQGLPTHAMLPASLPHATAPETPRRLLPPLVGILYLASSALVFLLWWMGVSPARFGKWLQQQGLALIVEMAELRRRSAAMAFLDCRCRAILHHLLYAHRHTSIESGSSGVGIVTEAPGVLAGQGAARQGMEGLVRVLAEQVEEARREVVAVRVELAEHKGRLAGLQEALTQTHLATQRSWEALMSVWCGDASKSTHVELQNVHRLSTTALRLLSTISHLQHVDLDGSAGFSAEGVRLLYKLPRLEDLSLRDTAVSDDALIGIGEAKSLARLYLSRTQVTDAGLLHIAAISSLNTLSLLGCLGVTGIGMVHVGRLGGLEWLYLQGTGVDDAGLHNLAYLTKLHVLYLPGGECVDHEKLCRQVGR
ncbi:unnamed protein product, partial [Closterium sp. NIES-54]